MSILIEKMVAVDVRHMMYHIDKMIDAYKIEEMYQRELSLIDRTTVAKSVIIYAITKLAHDVYGLNLTIFVSGLYNSMAELHNVFYKDYYAAILKIVDMVNFNVNSNKMDVDLMLFNNTAHIYVKEQAWK